MPQPGNAAALIALDAVALDTETTGLDPARAAIVEIAIVPLDSGRLDATAGRVARVRPDVPVPAAASAVHGIDDAALAGAPDFAAAWPPFAAAIDGRVVIGHSIGYDLAVIGRACARAGLAVPAPRCLDIALLARIARPDLAGHSLDQLAAFFGIAIQNRHSALGDAMAAGEIFLALAPMLREQGIRTVAEAGQACRRFTDALDAQHLAGWADIAAPAPGAAAGPPPRLDPQPFRRRVADIMSPAQVTSPATTLADTVSRMAGAKISSLFVGDPGAPLRAAEAGIVTERDVLRAIAGEGAAALSRTVGTIATRPVASVPADGFVYRAMARMRRLGIRHLGVVDDAGMICGAVSARDLLRQRAEEAIAMGDAIDGASGPADLARIWTVLPEAARSLLAEAVPGRDIAAVISAELCALSRRAAELAEQRMRDDGQGEPPCPYAFAVLGSAGRGESLLAMDQDNALVFTEGEPDGPADRWFAAFAGHVADTLDAAGVPFCRGGVMARNPPWRGSLATWRTRIGGWIARSRPQDLLCVDIFFDLAGVHGDAGLSTRLRDEALAVAAGEIGFAKLLADAAGPPAPGIGLFGRLLTEAGRIDLKRTGLFGIVTAARVLAIRHGIAARATPARLAAVKALGIGAAGDLDALDAAHAVFTDLILAQQVEDLANGVPPGNSVAVKRLSTRDRARLHEALEAVRHVDAMTRDLLFRG